MTLLHQPSWTEIARARKRAVLKPSSSCVSSFPQISAYRPSQHAAWAGHRQMLDVELFGRVTQRRLCFMGAGRGRASRHAELLRRCHQWGGRRRRISMSRTRVICNYPIHESSVLRIPYSVTLMPCPILVRVFSSPHVSDARRTCSWTAHCPAVATWCRILSFGLLLAESMWPLPIGWPCGILTSVVFAYPRHNIYITAHAVGATEPLTRLVLRPGESRCKTEPIGAFACTPGIIFEIFF